MRTTERTWTSMASATLWCVAFAAALALMWPATFGGSAVFVVVRGESMEPTYHTGDLLYARSASTFAVGEIAVYERQSTDDDALVVHRISNVLDDGTFEFKGDNRLSVDHYRPTSDEILAKPIANLGPLPTQILVRLPLLLAVLVAITVTWALWPRRDEDHPPPGRPHLATPSPAHGGDPTPSDDSRLATL